MKKIILILSILLAVYSCNNDDDNNPTNPLNGKWFLNMLVCECIGDIITNFTEEYVLWNINTNTKELEIINYTSDNGVLASGFYNFTYNDNSIDIITEDTTFSFRYTINESNNLNLIFGNPEIDAGFGMSFTKKETDCTDNPLEDLNWLVEIITNFNKIDLLFGAHISQFIYNEDCVYVKSIVGFEGETFNTIYNTQGEIICEIFCDISGCFSESCLDFFDTATNKRILY
jgi:hypothetical protein